MKEEAIRDLMVHFDAQVKHGQDFAKGVKFIIALMNANDILHNEFGSQVYVLNNEDKINALIKMYETLDNDKKTIFADIVENEQSLPDYIRIKFMSYANRNKPVVLKDEVKVNQDKNEVVEEEKIVEKPKKTSQEKKKSFLQAIIDDIKTKELCRFEIDGHPIFLHTYNNKTKADSLIEVYNNLDEEKANELVKLIDEDESLDIEIKEVFAQYIIELSQEYEKHDREEKKKELEELLEDIADFEKDSRYVKINDKTTKVDLLIDIDSRVDCLKKEYEQLNDKQKEMFVDMIENHKTLDSEIKELFNYAIKDNGNYKSSDRLHNYLIRESKYLIGSNLFDQKMDEILSIIAKNDKIQIIDSKSSTYFMPLKNKQKASILKKIYALLDRKQQKDFKEKIDNHPALSQLGLVFEIAKENDNDSDIIDVEASSHVVDDSPAEVARVVPDVVPQVKTEHIVQPSSPISIVPDVVPQVKTEHIVQPSSPISIVPDGIFDDDSFMVQPDEPRVIKQDEGSKKNRFKVIGKKALKWSKNHKRLLIAIGLAVLVAALYLNPMTHMMINSALWHVVNSLGMDPSLLAKLHHSNLALAKLVKDGSYSFISSGYYTLGGKLSGAVLYSVAKAKLVAALAGLAGLGSAGMALSDLIKNRKRKKAEKNVESYEEDKLVLDNPEDIKRKIDYLKMQLADFKEKEKDYIEEIDVLEKALDQINKDNATFNDGGVVRAR